MREAKVSPSRLAQSRLYYATGCTSKLTKLPSYRKARGQRRWSETSEQLHGLYRLTESNCPGGFINSGFMNTPDAGALSAISLTLARSSLYQSRSRCTSRVSLSPRRAKSLRSTPSVVSNGTGQGKRERLRARRQGQLWNDERMCTNTVSILICLFVAAPHSLSVSPLAYNIRSSQPLASVWSRCYARLSLRNLYALFASVAASTNKYKKLFQLLVWRHVSRNCACSFAAFLLERMTN